MDAKIRTFIALDITPKSRPLAYALGQKLATSGALIKWEPEEKFHITLKFLGEIPNSEIYDICCLTQQTVADFSPFIFRLCGVSAFPSIQKPRSVWLGVKEGKEEITALARAVDAAMQTRGFPRELKPYTPHLTLGRLQRFTSAVNQLSQMISQYDTYDAGKTFAQHITIYASHLARTGSRYTVLATAPLTKKS
ncbi:MAG: RNA 2',3'-cyclic phosphodiesterase [Planctomycetia bacterium]|nr:RNA 2',3'-cyclic phosphodiesterase [Planctomycetia bacterium]